MFSHIALSVKGALESECRSPGGTPHEKKGRRGSPSEQHPFTKPQHAYLAKALTAGLTAIGDTIAEKITEVETEVATIKHTTTDIDNKVTGLATEHEDLKKIVQDLQTELKKVKEGDACSTTSSQRSHKSCSDPHRTIAVIGSLGYDTLDTTLVERAHEALRLSGVNKDCYSSVAAMCRKGGTGSMVELVFTSRPALDEAVVRIRTLDKTYDGSRKPPWLSVKMSDYERRPMRVLRKVTDVLQEHLHAEKQVARDQIAYNHRLKTIAVAGTTILNVDKEGEIVWKAGTDVDDTAKLVVETAAATL